MEGGEDPPDPAGAGTEPESGATRAALVTMVVWWGLVIGLAAGAVAGTFVVPVLGTGLGAVYGLLATIGPTVAGGIALWVAARPGTPQDRYRQRARVILALIGVACLVGWAVSTSVDGLFEEITFATFTGVLVALALLVRAERSIGAFVPQAHGASRGPEIAVLAIVAVVAVVGIGRVAWVRAIGPEARGKKAVLAVRDDVGDAMGVALGMYPGPAAKRITCEADGQGIASGYASTGEAQDTVATPDLWLDRAARHLVATGYRVVRHRSADDPWVYGWRRGRTVQVAAWRPPGSETGVEVSVRVAHGCPDVQPLLQAEREPEPMLTSATYTTIEGDPPQRCPDGTLARVLVVAMSDARHAGPEDPVGWQLTAADGTEVAPCSATHGGDEDLVGLYVPADAPTATQVRLQRPYDPDWELEAIDQEVAVTPPDRPAAPVTARPYGGGPIPFGEPIRECPTATVQGVALTWGRPLPSTGDRPDVAEVAAGRRRALRVVIEDEGGRRTVTPLAVVEADPIAPRFGGVNRLVLCLDRPGVPLAVRGAASDQFDLDGPATEPFDLTFEIPRW